MTFSMPFHLASAVTITVRPEAQASGHDHRIRQLEPASRPQLGGEPGDVGREVDDPHLRGEALHDLHRLALPRRSGPTRISA